MTRALLAPLELLYAAALRTRNRHYNKAQPLRLRQPVISIGNLSVGGSGKTPLVIHLAKILEREGWSVDVISRGYRRGGDLVERVEESGDAERFGDEPLLIAQSAHVPVYVGASRYQAGLRAEREIPNAPKRIHLLDDGFQHRQLARAIDIVLVHRDDLTDSLLPAGRLRERLTALERADVIVLREEDSELTTRLSPYLRSETPVWRVKRTLSVPSGQTPVLAFCAIARPRDFYQALKAQGSELVATKSFRDHHPYTQRDIESLRQLASRYRCEAMVTTEKDAVKLDAKLRESLSQVAPLRVARLSLQMHDETAAMEHLSALLDSSRN
ncbi:MAG TPA: tetraacyldisaccharide 4'-kinase [Acidobacteriaceae bacterium]